VAAGSRPSMAARPYLEEVEVRGPRQDPHLSPAARPYLEELVERALIPGRQVAMAFNQEAEVLPRP